jgi:hypothetical protein
MSGGVDERFWSKVDRSGGENACWPWRAALLKTGYGAFNLRGKISRAHRVAWELTRNASPGELHVCHTCDNRPCCNPNHLFLGTRADNMADMARKGRNRKPHGMHGENNPAAVLSEQDVVDILRALSAGVRGNFLAAVYGVSDSRVASIKHRRSWRHIQC